MKDWATVLGRCLVTADEIEEARLEVRLSVDGETWFEANTAAPRTFLAHHLLAYVSDNETLYPRDVLGTGTVSHSCSMDVHRWPPGRSTRSVRRQRHRHAGTHDGGW